MGHICGVLIAMEDIREEEGAAGNYLPSDKSCVPENYFSYFSTRTYVVGTQKNHLDETVLLSTRNICLN